MGWEGGVWAKQLSPSEATQASRLASGSPLRRALCVDGLGLGGPGSNSLCVGKAGMVMTVLRD